MGHQTLQKRRCRLASSEGTSVEEISNKKKFNARSYGEKIRGRGLVEEKRNRLVLLAKVVRVGSCHRKER